MKRKWFWAILGITLATVGYYYRSPHDITLPPVAEVERQTAKVVTPAAEPAPIDTNGLAQVTRVIDGDTIVLASGEHFRYIGIDTPEEADARKPVQCFAREATEKNKELVEGKMIRFKKDVDEHDRYGRLLGFVYLLDGTFVNLELVKQGYAFAYPYPPDISKSVEFRDAERYARDNKLGLWNGKCTIETLKSGREQTNAVQ